MCTLIFFAIPVFLAWFFSENFSNYAAIYGAECIS